MRRRSMVLAAVTGVALVAGAVIVAHRDGGQATAAPPSPDEPPTAVVAAVARDLRLTPAQARQRLLRQTAAHQVAKSIPAGLQAELAGVWFDVSTGKLTVAVTNEAAAATARAHGATALLVGRSRAELERLLERVRVAYGPTVAGVNSFGIDPIGNDVVITVNRAKKDQSTQGFLTPVAGPGVRVVEVNTSLVQQSGEVNPGDPWWPGGESNCSVGYAATDSSGGKHFVTAGHCTNDANQPAYGESLQRNRIGTSNVGGNRSVNAREGDMGVVAVTEAGWTLSANVNTWGQPAVTITGSKDAIVGEAVCHSGNTAPNFECGTVNSVNQTVDYGNVIIDGLTLTTACSQGGDSGGAWLAGDKAVGVHSGGESSCSPGQSGDNSVFQPVNEALTKWGLTLVTGSGDDTQPPTAPGNPRSTGTTTNSVSLAWNASSDNVGVTAYDVYNGSSLATTVTSLNATVGGLASDTEYTFTVKARDAAGNTSPASNVLTARTQPGSGGDDEPPTTPGNPRATATTSSSVSLAWDASVDNVGVTGYDVFNGTALATTVTSPNATVSGLTADTAYSFTIQAKDAAGNKSKATKPVSVRTQPGGGGRTFTNGTDYPIRDGQVTISTVQSTASGPVANPMKVSITATHTCQQDLNITVVSPSGWYYYLQSYGGWPCTPFPGTRTFTVQPFNEPASGTWTLRIGDNGPGDIGVLDSWSITL